MKSLEIMPTTKKKLSLYLDETLKLETEKLAKAESRSVNNLIEVLLKEAISKAKEEGKI